MGMASLVWPIIMMPQFLLCLFFSLFSLILMTHREIIFRVANQILNYQAPQSASFFRFADHLGEIGLDMYQVCQVKTFFSSGIV